MNIIESIATNVWVQRLFWSAIVILVNIMIYHAVSKFLAAKEKRSPKILSEKKNKTFIRMLKSFIGYALLILAMLTILQIFGVNVTSMLAGVGIAGIVIGFALQDTLKDVIRGLDIVSDNYYEIGDVVKYGDNVGQVLSISLRTTKLQDINTMNTVSIANRNIDQVEIVSGYIYISVPIPYQVRLGKAEAAMQEIVKTLAKHQDITSAAYQGISDLTSSSCNHQLYVVCSPMDQLQVRRDALKVIIETLEANKITISHNQLDVHTKK